MSSLSPGTVWLGNEFGRKAVSSPDVGQSCRVCFRNLTDERLVLCWVNESGAPHHFYALEPYTASNKHGFLRGFLANSNNNNALDTKGGGGGDHVETTVEGHAFLVGGAAKKTGDVDSVRKQRSLDDAVVVGAYRPEKQTTNGSSKSKEKSIVHLVEVVDPALSPVNRFQNLFTCCVPSKRKWEDDDDDDDGEDSNSNVRRYILRVRLIEVDDQPIDTTCKQYESTTLGHCEWPVMVEKDWYGDDAELERVLARDLDHMASCLPPHALQLLRDQQPTPIWINATFQCGPKRCPKELRHMCFHPGKSWLEQNGMHAEKTECVELYCAADYRKTRTHWGVGGLLLHEFSHAYHHKGCPEGYKNPEIQDCYEQAMKEGLYDCVQVHGTQGPTAKAYACTNAMEYFAELSAAFLGGTPSKQRERGGTNGGDAEEYNKWYPFHRQQIREHDPRAYQLLKKMWKVQDD